MGSNFVNLWVIWPTSILLLAHFWKVSGGVGTFTEEKLFRLGDCSKHLEIMKGN